MARNTAGRVHQKSFATIPSANIPRSVFNRSYNYKTALNSGYLYPIFADEALPGDTIAIKPVIFGRMATPLFPIMDNIYLDFHMWAIPLRLVWDNFQKFMGEQDNPDDSTDFVVPQVVSGVGGFGANSLYDYLGYPPNSTSGTTASMSAFYTRAYNLVWNQWYRSENLQDSVVVDKDDGPDAVGDYVLLRRGKRHDYFTSALPWPQKGDPVSLPLGVSAPVTGNIVGDGTTTYPTMAYGGAVNDVVQTFRNNAGDLTLFNATNIAPTGAVANQPLYWVDPALSLSGAVADLSTATAATINEIRMAFQMQKLFERDARGGTRYVELLRSHFGVVSPDQRLQRCEYLGGGTLDISINPVAKTNDGAVSTTNRAMGALAAYGVVAGGIPTISKSFTEHCIILGLVSIRADLNYQQGVPRQFMRSTKYDFYWPALAHLGEQEITSREIYEDGTAGDDTVFGYQERWAEYRYKPSQITGIMRSQATVSLDAWHLAQDFAARPLLNEAFIVENPPMSRIMAAEETEDTPSFYVDANFSFKHVRPMPTYSVPGLIDHF